MIIHTIVQVFRRIFCRKNTTRHTGTIKFFDRKKRFGFIMSNNQEYFFHASATKSENFKGLRDGTSVSFIVISGKKGPQADEIELLTT